MRARAAVVSMFVLGAALPLGAADAPPVEVDLLEFLGEIEISGEDWAVLADAESVAQPAVAAPASGTKESKDGKH